MIPKDIFVVDGFYSNPEQVRSFALRADYTNFGDEQNFPGAESEKSFFSSNHKETFEKLIGKPIITKPDEYVFGKFRYSTKEDFAHTKVHLDHGVEWTGIIYLTKDEDCRGGLGIYRHKKTGLNKAPELYELETYHCTDICEFDGKYVYPDSKKEDAWEKIYEIPLKFNRLILFQGSKYFHGITEQFGNSINDARLTQNFFFQEKLR